MATLLVLVAMAAKPASAVIAEATRASVPASKLVRWEIQKLKLVHGEPKIFVIGSNKQYIPRACTRYEVESFKYHFNHEEAYELEKHVFYGATFIEGFRGIVDERKKNQAVDIVANIVAIACLERQNYYKAGEYGLRAVDCNTDHTLREELLTKIGVRLAVISHEKWAVENAAATDTFALLPEDVPYTKLVLIERKSGKRYAFLARSDNDPTVQFGFVK